MPYAMTDRARATLLGAIAPVVWGTTYAVTTELLPPDRPMTAALLRAAPAGVLLLLLTRQIPPAGWWGRLVVLAVLNIGAFFPLLFLGAYRLPGGLAAVVGSAQPLIVAAVLLLAFRQSTPARQLLWAVLAVTGVGLAVFAGPVTVDALGITAALAGTASMATGVVLTRRWGLPPRMSGLAVTGWQLVLGAVVIAPLVPVLDTGPFVLDGPAIAGYTWLAVPGTTIAYAVWFSAGRRLPATSTAMLGALSPVVAALVGWVWLGQALSGVQSAGFALALVAALLGQTAAHRPAGTPRRPGGEPAGCPGRVPAAP